MHFDGIIIGFTAFLIMGLFHPLIIHGEYHFGIKIWLLFLCMGIIFSIASIYYKKRHYFRNDGYCGVYQLLEHI